MTRTIAYTRDKNGSPIILLDKPTNITTVECPCFTNPGVVWFHSPNKNIGECVWAILRRMGSAHVNVAGMKSDSSHLCAEDKSNTSQKMSKVGKMNGQVMAMSSEKRVCCNGSEKRLYICKLCLLAGCTQMTVGLLGESQTYGSRKKDRFGASLDDIRT